MIDYNSGPTGLSARVKNIKTKEEFIVSTAKNSFEVYETAVFRSSGLWGFLKQMVAPKPLYVANSSSLDQAEQTHVKTAKLFEQLDPKELIRNYKSFGIGGSQQLLVKENTGAEKAVTEGKEYVKGKKAVIDGKEYTLDDATPEELRQHVFDTSIIESDPLQWFKQANIVFEWSETFKDDDEGKFAFIIILCASTITKDIQELFKGAVDAGTVDASTFTAKWADVFLIIISIYLDTPNVSDEWGKDLFKLIGQPFFFASPEGVKEAKINNIINDWQIRRRTYADYKDPCKGYVAELIKLFGKGNFLFVLSITTLALKYLNRYMSLYQADIKGKSVDLGILIEKSIS